MKGKKNLMHYWVSVSVFTFNKGKMQAEGQSQKGIQEKYT